MVFSVCQFCSPQPWSWSLGWSMPVPVHSIPTSAQRLGATDEQRDLLAGCHRWLGLRQTHDLALPCKVLGWGCGQCSVQRCTSKCSARWVIRYSSHFPPSGKVARPSPELLTLEIQGELEESRLKPCTFPTVWKGRAPRSAPAGTWSRQRKRWEGGIPSFASSYLFFFPFKPFIFNVWLAFSFFFYFTILYWFCHTSTWIRHRCTLIHP